MSFPRYGSYRPSEVEWLDDLPEHWSVGRLGYETWVRARLGWKGLKAEEYVEEGYALLATPNIKGNLIDFENVNFIDEDRYNESPEIKLSVGDILLAKDGSTLGTVNVVRHLPVPATVNSSIAVITPGGHFDSVYGFYIFQSSYMDGTIQRIKGGMGVPHLFQADLNKFQVPLPPLLEQAAIAAFLDRETSKIDALVDDQKRLIALLKEKRQAVISHAVTNGLNPDAPMKDSGVEWLGEVPAHWTSASVRRLLSGIEQGWSPDCESRPASEEEWGVLKAGCNNGGVFREQENKALPANLVPMPEYEVRPGDVLMSRANGSADNVGAVAFVASVRPRLMLSDKIFRLQPSASILPAYLAILLSSRPLRFKSSVRSAVPTV